ncbi:gamma-glutamyltransferase [Glycocaulis alkaliphilus]|uniref:Glutathione hydrolase proenzyme n=1 Tax=Glycocaulis alkaliphilus TaxID=1434191 RepID=A0A3T0ECF8_9PROT|nr:gamma-glutamyltransferase [Glycocaulis alkaliphilus]AZU04979.1 gamma-glutamyltransferase [Glycocaulis alkaliphilus]GGB66233.1 gamma-glutamyltransferase [Glycocaulis alkaliphilus]
MYLNRFLLTAALPFALIACSGDDSAQQSTSGPVTGSEEAMVSAAHPLAVEAGLDVLRRGGDAVDAAIAVQMVLGLVEPQSSGIAGGAFMVRYDAQTGAVTVYDGRETAPAAVTEDYWLDENGEPLAYLDAWQSGQSTGAPGAVAMLAMAHEEHGRLDWSASFEAGIELAEEGFPLSGRTSAMATRVAQISQLSRQEPARSYFYDEEGNAHPEGFIRTNPGYADTLRAVAADWHNFYTGEIAQDIIATASRDPRGGLLTLEDLEAYEPVRREAICVPYRVYQVCSAPPPSSGAVAVGAILTLLEGFEMSAFGPDTVEGWHLFIEASRLAYADRDQYVGDPAFADVPVEGLLDHAYLTERRRLISIDAAIPAIRHGTPPGAPEVIADTTPDAPGTTHYSIRDTFGNVVSMTTTVESIFGNNRMTQGGFLLNNQLTDFAFVPRDADGRTHPNAPASGKRPRSSMSPTIVLDAEGDFLIATGSPGGNSIIAYTAKTLVAMLDWGMTPQEAAALPNIVARGDVVSIESGFDAELLESLRALGHQIRGEQGENSGIHIIRLNADGMLEGGADPRRDGVAGRP